ncbi:concanavalin A-like lectin/glucanase domain-containing protein [Lophiotrema nucula]|uniref:Concanavalin A-like lectin/glucanase domain-containing protein n=1 Tax=Lophiotrema nucula TaxID=690887 RepID=A0A6A5ZJ66_9PLEO|nr:concanavalin A-like lectin/glucanase domain-containing protein [Lophiotrema nucula]
MLYSMLLGSLVMVTGVVAQEYTLIQTYNVSNFFNEFTFYSDVDPTGGFVDYTTFDEALAQRLINNISDYIYLGVDHENTVPETGVGRPSVRLESRLTFTEGLFVLDLKHLPVGCGTWPAFWTVGLGKWPADGEIDIIEGVNDASGNEAALHAAGDCQVSKDVDQTGTWKSTDCNIDHDKNQGCGSQFAEAESYGAPFNDNGGGVYAMEWTNETISIWFFVPNNVPESLLLPDSIPDTSEFGTPSASFYGPCSEDFSKNFFNHTIVIDTTFCGGWGGSTFGKGSGTQCVIAQGSTSEDSCKAFVANNPEAFNETYWAINSLRVWQKLCLMMLVRVSNRKMAMIGNGTTQTQAMQEKMKTVKQRVRAPKTTQ